MPRGRDTGRGTGHGWFGAQWLAYYEKYQADLIRDLRWSRAKASDVVTGKQRYNQDIVEELALYLNLHPSELLLHPDDAMANRRLKQAVRQIVGGGSPPEEPGPTAPAAVQDVPSRNRKAG